MKIDLTYGEGKDTFLLDLEELKILSFEKDFEAMEGEKKQYYTSCSGLSGAGWIKSNKYVEIGSLRIDKGMQHRTIAIGLINIYAIYEKNKGFCDSLILQCLTGYGNKFVVIECINGQIPKTKKNLFKEIIKDFEKYTESAEFYKLTKKYYIDGKESEINIQIYSDEKIHYDLKLLNIYDLGYEIALTNKFIKKLYKLEFLDFKIYFNEKNWYLMDKYQLLNKMDTSLNGLMKQIGYNVKCLKKITIFYKLIKSCIYDEYIGNEYYIIAVKLNQQEKTILEYETYSNVLQLKEGIKKAYKGLNKKITMDYINNNALMCEDAFKKIKEINKNIKTYNSYKVGNCETGTSQFIKKFDLKLNEENNEILLSSLLDKNKFEDMYRNSGFVKSINYFILEENNLKIKDYCTNEIQDCSKCNLVNYNKDCMNNPI